MTGRYRRGLVSGGRFRRSRLSVGTCSAMSAYCRDVFGEIGLVSGRVQRSRLIVGMFRRGLVSVGTCYAESA